MKKKIYFLVYQAGIANVFVADVKGKSFNNHRRIKQDSFKSCEEFCRGLRESGARLKVAWCNQAGDITGALWRFSSFDNAPFSDLFARDFVGKPKISDSGKHGKV